MDFLKKHYEKVILSVVLLVLAGAAAALPMQVSHVREQGNEQMISLSRTRSQEFKPVDISTNEAVFARLNQPLKVELSGPHNLFNPVLWKKTTDGRWIKEQTGKELGAAAVKVAKIDPLYLKLVYEGLANLGEPAQGNPPLQISVLNDSDRNARAHKRYVKIGDHNRLFTLRDATPAQNPTSVILALEGEKAPIVLKLNAPFQRVIGYAADLAYPPARQTFRNQRVGDSITLNDDGSTYKIVAIDAHEVVLSADSTQKRTILELASSP